MAPFSWSRWLRSLFLPRVKSFRNPACRLAVENLETRLAPATFTWTGLGTNTNWSTNANWLGGVAPSVTDPTLDDLVFPGTPAPARFNPTDDIVGLAIGSLTISGSGYTLSGNNGVLLTLGDPGVSGSGAIVVGSGVSNDTIKMNMVLAGPGNGSRQFFTIASNSTLTIAGNLSGTTGAELTKEGTGTLILTGNNSGFTGPFTLDNSAGIVQITSATALGSGAGSTTVGTGSQLQISSVNGITISENLILNAAGGNNTGALLNVAGNNTWSGSVTLDSDVTLGSSTGDLTISGVVSDRGAGHSIIKEGAGTITLSASNTYRGTTTINNGILALSNGNALGLADGTAATAATVNSNSLETGTLELDNNITVSNELLVLNGAGFGGTGALFGNTGNNVWAGNIILGSAAPYGSSVTIDVAETSTLTVSGVSGAPIGTSAVSSPNDPTGNFTLTKTDVGTLIFTTANSYTGATVIANGILEIEDSSALGTLTKGTTVANGGTLELAVDNINDTVTGNTASLVVSEPIAISGDGFSGLGAIYSNSGINFYAATITLTGGLGSIGVDPDLTPTGAPYNYGITAGGTVLDDSLSITGVITGGSAGALETLDKLGNGQLILPGPNTYVGPTNIQSGWVTLEDPRGLGSRVAGWGDSAQPVTTVADGAALHLLPLTGNMTLPYNLNLTGTGIQSDYPLVNQQGALMSLAGINSVSGNITLSGPVGIGVEQIFSSDNTNVNFSANAPSQLTLTGQQGEAQAVLSVSVPSNGGPKENDNVIKVGATSGTLTVNANVLGIPDDVRIYDGNFVANPSTAVLLYDSTTNGDFTNPTNKNTATIVVNYTSTNATVTATQTGSGSGWNPGGSVGPYGPVTSTDITIVVNQGNSRQKSTQWNYKASIVPNVPVGGGIIKLGSQRLIVQGPGTYTGDVDIQQGVLLNQNNTGLGSGVGTTTVEDGAALELANGTAPENGGIQAGLNILGETLVLNGTGNAAFGDTPLTVLSSAARTTDPVNTPIVPSDNMWRGPVTLGNSATITVQPNSRLNIFGTIDDGAGSKTPPTPADLTLTGGGELDLQGSNTYRGTTFVNQGVLSILNSQALGGTGIAEVQTITLTSPVANSTQFNLAFNGQTTASPITYTGTAADTAAIATALNQLSTVQGLGGVVTVTQKGNVFTVTFGGGLAGFDQPQMTGAIVMGTPGTINTDTVSNGAGGTVVTSGASLSLQGNLTIAGEPLEIQGSGVGTGPSVPQQWFPLGAAPILNGQTAGSLNVSGRVTGVAVDTTDPTGNTIYISTAGGGAWKTINATSANPTWVPIFDGIAGGVVGAIAIAPSDPRVIYLGTGEADNSTDSYYGTGVYKSTDSGKTWTLLAGSSGNPLYGQAVSRIVVDPFNPNLIYVASSDLAVNRPTSNVSAPGVWRFNGSSWFDLTAVVSPNRDPANGVSGAPNTAGPDDDFRISFPQTGATWSDLAIDTTGTLYAALGTAGGALANGVFRCSNPTSTTPIWDVGNGAVNSQSSSEFPTGAAGSTTNSNIKIGLWNDVFGQGGDVLYAAITAVGGNLLSIQKSTDGGRTWGATANAAPNYMNGQGDYDSTIVVSPVNPNIVYVGGHVSSSTTFANQLFTTPDGGTTWIIISIDGAGNGPHTDAHASALDSKGNLILGSDGGVWQYGASTAVWKDFNGNLATVNYNGVATDPNNLNSVYGGAQNNGVSQFTGAPGWTFDNTGSGGLVRLNPNSPNIVYEASGGQLLESTSGGQLGTWTSILNVNGGFFPFVIDSVNPSRLVVGGAGGAVRLQESLNGGATWQNLNAPINVTALAIATYQGSFQADLSYPTVTDKGSNTYDPNTIYITNGTQVFLTKDHGLTWVNRTGNLLGLAPQIHIQSLTVDPRNRDTIYAVSSTGLGYGQGRVFVSTNAGLTWTDITRNLPDVPVWDLVIDPRSGLLYLGNDLGVYTSTGGGNWQRVGAGLPQTRVTDLTLNVSNNTLTVATYGRSIYQIFLDPTTANAGALTESSGTSVWTGRVFLTGPTTLGAGGTQAVRNGLATASINFIGTIADLTPGANNYLTKTGPGNVVFSGSNTYGGITEVQQGALVVQNLNALGATGNGTLVDTGAALQLASSVAGEPLTLNGIGPTPGFNGHSTGALENISSSNTYSGPITLASATIIGVDTGSTLTLTSTASIGDGGKGIGLAKELTGTLVLQAASTYSGSTQVNQGILNIQNSQALGAAGTSTTVLDGAQLQLQGGITVVGESLRISGTGIFNSGALESVGGTNFWRGNITLAQDPGLSPPTTPPSAVSIGVLYNALGDSLGLKGAISQVTGAALGLTKVGIGTLILDNNANTYVGVTTVSAGTLRIKQGGALGTPTNGTIVQSGAALEIDGDPTGIGSGTGIVIPGEPLTLNGTGAPEVQALVLAGSAGSFTLSFTNQATGVTKTTASLAFNATASQVQSALNGLSNIGSNGVTVTQTGSTYLIIFTGSPLSTANQNLIVATGTGGVTPAINPVRDGGQGALSNLTGVNQWSGAITLQTNSIIGAAGGTSLLASGVIQDPATIPVPAPTLTKVGNGTVSLSNANTYSGTTYVNGGILNVRNNSALGVPVNEVQTITVTGSITGSYTLQFMNSPLVTLSGNTGTTTATQVRNAINGLLTSLGINGTVSVTQSGAVYTVTFDGGAVAGLIQPQLVAVGSAGTIATVATVRDGSNGTVVANGATLQVQGGITLSNEPLTITGAGFGGIGALDSPSGTNTWDSPITLAGAASIGADTDSTPAVSMLTIDQVIGQSVTKSPLTKVGTGIVLLSGTASNTYTGLTTVANGTLELGKTGAIAIPADLTVGTGALPPGSAVAQLEGNNQIPSTQALTVNSDGFFDLNGNTQVVASLTMTGGTAALTGITSQLTVTGGVTGTSDSASPANPGAITGLGTLALTSASPTITATGSGLPDSTPNLMISAPITTTAPAGITKAGIGVLQVTSNNPTLPVTAAAGTILADGEPAISETFGTVTLNGGTVGGSGSVVSIVPAAGPTGGGTIQPAENSFTPTTLTTTTTAAQTWNTATTLSLVLNDQSTGDYSVLALNGNLNINGASLGGFAGLGVHLGDTFTVLTTTGTITGAFASYGKDTNGEDIVFVGGQKFDALYTGQQVILTRVQATATVTLSSSVASPPGSVYGQGVTFSATVTPETGAGPIVNTDTVTFTLDNNAATLTAATTNGVAIFDPIAFFSLPLSVGTHTITAVFNGDNTFAATDPAFPATITQTVIQASTSFTLGANTTSPVPAQPVTLTATFSPVSPGAGVPTGQAIFTVDGRAPIGATLTDGTASNGTVTLNPAGQALLVLNNLPFSQHRIRVFYLGDTNFKPIASSSDFLVNVIKGTANIQVAANPLSSSYGQTVAFTATLSGPVVPSGLVSFYNGPAIQTNLLAPPAPLDANGQITINTAALTAGTHTITVFYAGNTSYVSGMMTFNYVVSQAITETALTSPSSITAYGQPLNLTASLSVDLPGQGVPVGTVTFFDNGTTQIGNPVVVGANGLAVFGFTNLGVGQHSITARYNGNPNFTVSTSNAVSQTVQVGVVVTVTSNATLNQAVSGQTLSLTATVKGTAPGGTPPPDGEVITFLDTTTGITLGTANLGNTGIHGTAVLTNVTGLSIGTHIISATYAGDTSGGGSFLGNTSSFTLTVVKDNTTTKVTSSGTTTPAPTYGSDITFTATVTANLPGSGTPTGTVKFYDGPVSGGKLLGSNTLSGGVATIDTTALSAGAHTIYAFYADDSQFNPSTGTVTQTVNQDHTTTALTESSAGSASGAAFYSVPVTLTATVTANFTGNAVPSGTVTFADTISGTRTLGTASVNASGIATLVVPNLTVGNHNLTATYGTSTSFLTSTSNTVPLAVAPNNTNTVVTSSVNPSFFGQMVTFTATVTANLSNVAVASGTVKFYDGSTLLGSNILGATGKATFSISTLAFDHPASPHTINATFVANTNYLTSTGSTSQTVLYNSGVTVNSSAAAPVYGQDFTFTATIATKTTGGTGLFSGTVTFFDAGKVLFAGVPVSGSGSSIKVTLANSALTAPLAAGSHSITASFIADSTSDFISSVPSAAVSQKVNQDATTTTITAPTGTPGSPFQTVYGAALTFTATVTANLPGSGTPAGKVNFFDGSTLIGSGTLDVNGQATFPDSTLGAGVTHTITAKYLGNTNFVASPANPSVTVAVSQAQTNTVITATTLSGSVAATNTVYGQAITFVATVTAITGGGAPVGPVFFADVDTGASVGTVNLTATGPNTATATLVVSSLAVGDHHIAATFGNTTNYGASTTAPSNNWEVMVAQDATTTTVTSSAPISVVSQAVRFSATVVPAAPGGGGNPPTGSVAFYLDGSATPFATVALNKGVAVTPAVSYLTATSHQITAFYLPGGDPNFTASDNTGSPFTQVVQAQILTSLQAPHIINNAPSNSFFSFQVIGLDAAGRQDFAANTPVKVSLLGTTASGGAVVGQNNSLTFNFINGIATIGIKLTKPGSYTLLIDAGNGITAIITINTVGRLNT